MMFRFKKFSVSQEKTAMKVGTDGVLLGAWTPVSHRPQTILDIGAGTGLVALMLAQRSDAAQIDALEIDADAHEECTENFERSPWSDRLFCFHASLDDFIDELEDETYDLIACNPPFYVETVASGNEARDKARQNQSLPFADLVEAAGILLSDEGIFSVIIPFKNEADFIALAAGEGLCPQLLTRVKGTPESAVKRSLIAFGRTKIEPVVDEMAIEITRHQYTAGFRKLTGDFYL